LLASLRVGEILAGLGRRGHRQRRLRTPALFGGAAAIEARLREHVRLHGPLAAPGVDEHDFERAVVLLGAFAVGRREMHGQQGDVQRERKTQRRSQYPVLLPDDEVHSHVSTTSLSYFRLFGQRK
jgi:hypothetical protein